MGFFQGGLISSKGGFFQKGEPLAEKSFLGQINKALKTSIPAYGLLTGQPPESLKPVLESGLPLTRFLSTFLEQQSLVPREYAPPPTNIFQKGEVALGGAAGQIPAFLTGSLVAKTALKAPFLAKTVAQAGKVPFLGKFVEPAVREGLTGAGYGLTRPAKDIAERAKATAESAAFFAPFGIAGKVGGPVFKKLLPVPKLAEKGVVSAVKKAAVLGGGTAAIAGGEEFLKETDEETKNKILSALGVGAMAAPFALFGGLKATRQMVSKSIAEMAEGPASETAAKKIREVAKYIPEFKANPKAVYSKGEIYIQYDGGKGQIKLDPSYVFGQPFVETGKKGELIVSLGKKAEPGKPFTVREGEVIDFGPIIEEEAKAVSLKGKKGLVKVASLDKDKKTILTDTPSTVYETGLAITKPGTVIHVQSGLPVESFGSATKAKQFIEATKDINWKQPAEKFKADKDLTERIKTEISNIKALPTEPQAEITRFAETPEEPVKDIEAFFKKIYEAKPLAKPKVKKVPSALVAEAEVPKVRPETVKQRVAKVTGLVKPKKEVITTEEKLLQTRLQQQAKGAKAGFKVGSKEARESITNKLRTTFESQIARLKRKGELKELKGDILRRFVLGVKQDIKNYAIAKLPPKVRGRMLTAVANAKTQKDLIHSFFRIDNIATRVERQGLVEQLKKDLSEAAKSPSIAVSYRNLIKDTLLDITLKTYGKRTLTRLEKTKAFIERELVAGRNVEMPKRIIEALELLTKTPLREISNRELQDMVIKIDSLKKYGKFAETSRKINLKNDIAQVTDEIREAKTGPINTGEIKKAPIGDELPWREKLKNGIRKKFNEARFIELAITPMDVIFDMLDGSRRYTGPLFKHFKARVDADFAKYLNQSGEIKDRFIQLNKELKLKKSNFERIGIHAARVQDGGVKKLIDTGFTEKEINLVQLTETEEKMYQFMREELDKLKPSIDDVMANVYNKEVGKVKEYFALRSLILKRIMFFLIILIMLPI